MTETTRQDTQVIVATYRMWPALERGLLVFSRAGVSYTPTARAVGLGTGLALGLAAAGLSIVICVATGSFAAMMLGMGVVFVVAAVVGAGSRSSAAAQAAGEERRAVTDGLTAVRPLPGGWEVPWDSTQQVSVGGVAVTVVETGGRRRGVLLAAQQGELGHAGARAAAEAVARAVDQYAPGRASSDRLFARSAQVMLILGALALLFSICGVALIRVWEFTALGSMFGLVIGCAVVVMARFCHHGQASNRWMAMLGIGLAVAGMVCGFVGMMSW